MHKVEERIIKPTINGLQKEQIEYVGFLFFGLISVNGEPYVIEYNCRLGDPETEVILPRLESDLVGLLIAATQHELNEVTMRVDERAAATIVAVSKGYPLGYEKGLEINGIDGDFGKQSLVFQAGTIEQDGKLLTNGGRVLCVTSLDKNLNEAVNISLDILQQIDFENKYYRRDIGYEFIKQPL
jgi:phosphoribosylamine--glycine ligase